jgi:L-threonylcarbamoyladenylate synthase
VIGTDVALAASLLKEGKLVAIPTETVYGLGANALDSTAIASIYAVKNRPTFNPLILHFASWEAAQPYVKEVPEEITRLASKFCPGSISFLLQKTDLVSDIVTAGSSHVVVRVPDHPVTLELLSLLDFPLAAPSANISNTVSPTSAQHVEDGLGDQIEYVLDGGESKIGVESTIVSFQDNHVNILREGGVSREDIISLGFIVKNSNTEAIQTPGQFKKHYATKKPIYLVESISDYLEKNSDKRCSALLYEKSKVSCTAYLLSTNYDLAEIANNLFATMRRADADDTDLILIEHIKEEGIGRAVADRLRRASISLNA